MRDTAVDPLLFVLVAALVAPWGCARDGGPGEPVAPAGPARLVVTGVPVGGAARVVCGGQEQRVEPLDPVFGETLEVPAGPCEVTLDAPGFAAPAVSVEATPGAAPRVTLLGAAAGPVEATVTITAGRAGAGLDPEPVAAAVRSRAVDLAACARPGVVPFASRTFALRVQYIPTNVPEHRWQVGGGSRCVADVANAALQNRAVPDPPGVTQRESLDLDVAFRFAPSKAGGGALAPAVATLAPLPAVPASGALTGALGEAGIPDDALGWDAESLLGVVDAAHRAGRYGPPDGPRAGDHRACDLLALWARRMAQESVMAKGADAEVALAESTAYLQAAEGYAAGAVLMRARERLKELAATPAGQALKADLATGKAWAEYEHVTSAALGSVLTGNFKQVAGKELGGYGSGGRALAWAGAMGGLFATVVRAAEAGSGLTPDGRAAHEKAVREVREAMDRGLVEEIPRVMEALVAAEAALPRP
ncbi:hypothetical protein L6R50_04400 [Myxococcota bacterium]|nr:hypothetical protein [Myxococcota bacterium]